MNINECYGEISMPSEMGDSFENGVCVGPDSSEEHARCYADSDVNLDSSLDDTFLEKVVIPTGKSREGVEEQCPVVSIDKPEIVRYAFPKQELTETVQISNCTGRPTLVRIKCRFPLKHTSLPSQAIDGDSETFLIEGWQKMEVCLSLSQPQGDLGDIFETVLCEAILPQGGSSRNYRIEVTVHYIVPRLRMTYEGGSDVMSVYGNKVAVCEVAQNEWGEYHLQLAVQQVERLDCEVQVKGGLQVFPSQVVFYRGEPRKLCIRKESVDRNRKNAVIVRARDGSASFVFAVKMV